MLRRWWDKLRSLYRLARNERASPREIGWAVGIGAFAGCTPAVGFHGAVALAFATLLKKNRLFAWLGSRVSNILVLPFIVFAEIELAHRIRAGAWVALDARHALDEAGGLVLDWCLGTIPVGGAIGGLLGTAAWAIAARRLRRKLRRDSAAPSSRPPSDTAPT